MIPNAPREASVLNIYINITVTRLTLQSGPVPFEEQLQGSLLVIIHGALWCGDPPKDLSVDGSGDESERVDDLIQRKL